MSLLLLLIIFSISFGIDLKKENDIFIWSKNATRGDNWKKKITKRRGGDVPNCEIELKIHHCLQVCNEWCWATVISMFVKVGFGGSIFIDFSLSIMSNVKAINFCKRSCYLEEFGKCFF